MTRPISWWLLQQHDSPTYSGRDEIPQLITRSYDEGTERTWGELHQVDWHHTINTLHAELLEETSSDLGMAARKTKRV